MEEDHGTVVIGLDPPQLVGAATDSRHRHPRVHDDLIGKGDVVGGDRLAVTPDKVVPQHHFVEHPIGTGLPGCDRLAGGKGLKITAKGKQPEAGEAENIELGGRADHDRIGAAQVAADMPFNPG